MSRDIHIRFPTGEVLTIACRDGYHYICPACGYPDLYEPPFEPDPEGGARFPSHSICPSCDIEYGFDDADIMLGTFVSTVRRYWDLRLNWLNQHGWKKEQLEQLDKYLGITEAQARAYHAELAKKQP